MAANHHHQCHCQPTPHADTTCYCTTCSTTTHYSSPPPPPPANLHHHHYPPSQTHLHAPPYNHHTLQTQHHDYYPPPPPPLQTHQGFQHYRHQEDTPPPLNPTVSSLIHRIAALESSLRRRNRPPKPSSLRDAAARTIQTHFRAFLVRRSTTLRHLKHLAYIKSSLNNLKSSVRDKSPFDSQLFYRESMNLLIKLDSIQDSDPMIRDGKRSITRELIRFMEFIDEMPTENRVISVKNVRFSKNGKKSVVLQHEPKIRASSSRVLGDDETKFSQNLKNQFKKITGSSVPSKDEEQVENLELENPRKHGDFRNRIGGLLNNQRQPKVKKNVRFDENGNVYGVIRSSHGCVSSDDSESSNGDEEVEEIGVSSKETEGEEEDSSEVSDNDEIDPRNNPGTKIDHVPNKNHNEEDDDDDSFVFCAPLPAKMEYRVDSVKKKQGVKQ